MHRKWLAISIIKYVKSLAVASNTGIVSILKLSIG
jgi:hypothetical protein